MRPAVHRTILVVDVEHYGDQRRTNPHQLAVRDGMYRILERAFRVAGIPWADCRCEDRGDGVLVLAPALIAKTRFVEALPEALAGGLREHNRAHPAESRIRFRAAVHAGEIRFDDHGMTAPSMILTFRLIDAPVLKAALADSAVELAMIVSSWFFDEVVRHSPLTHADSYREVAVAVKETSTIGWIRLVERLDRSDADSAAPNGVAPPMSLDLFFAVVDALESIPCMSTDGDRALLIKHLRPAIAGAIRYHAQRRAHVMSILHACNDYEGGVDELLMAVIKIERSGSVPVGRLIDLLGGSTALRGLPRGE